MLICRKGFWKWSSTSTNQYLTTYHQETAATVDMHDESLQLHQSCLCGIYNRKSSVYATLRKAAASTNSGCMASEWALTMALLFLWWLLMIVLLSECLLELLCTEGKQGKEVQWRGADSSSIKQHDESYDVCDTSIQAIVWILDMLRMEQGYKPLYLAWLFLPQIIFPKM